MSHSRSCGRLSTLRSTGSPSTASARRTTRSCSSRTGRAASNGRPRVTSSSRMHSPPSARRSHGRSSPTARDRPFSSRYLFRVRPRTGKLRRSRDGLRRRHSSRRPRSGAIRTGGASSPRRGPRPGTVALRTSTTDRLSVSFDGAPVFVRGEPTGASPDLGGSAVTIDLDLGLGSGTASYLASDLTVDYVRLNSEYTT